MRPQEVPASTEPPVRSTGQWIQLAERVAQDRSKGLVTEVKVTGINEKALTSEVYRLRNGMRVPLQKRGLTLRAVIVRKGKTEARVFLETTQRPAVTRNGRS